MKLIVTIEVDQPIGTIPRSASALSNLLYGIDDGAVAGRVESVFEGTSDTPAGGDDDVVLAELADDGGYTFEYNRAEVTRPNVPADHFEIRG